MLSVNVVPWVVLLPAIGLLVNIAVGRRLGERGVALVACLASAAAFAASVILFVGLRAHPEGGVVTIGDWIRVGGFRAAWAFRVDTLSVTMMLVVSGVGTLIHVYASSYMHYDVGYKGGDPRSYRRFFVYLNLFIAAMMVLVGADNYLMLFVGWEGVGLCSYLLIGFWYGRNPDGTSGRKNVFAATKAFIVNRIGDFGFMIALFLTFWAFGTLEFDEVFARAASAPPQVLTAICLFMLLGVCGKSAQLPLHVWLPDAMAGPTPVSALIHAATMVTAGVYLVARSAPLFHAAPEAARAVATVGAATALFAAAIATGQNDIKKVLAYSTISQLGFMVAAVGMGAFVAGMFHLVTHAFFKALLFLSAGSVILAVERGHHPATASAHGGHDAHGDGEAGVDLQDMRNMGGLRRRLPVTFAAYLVGAAALSGIPPLAGFFSKDEILADAAHASPAIYLVLSAAAFLTAFYMGRQVWMVFFGEARTRAAAGAVESPLRMTVPLSILAVLAAAGGLVNLPGLHHLGNWLEHTLGGLGQTGEFDARVATVSTLLALAAAGLSWIMFRRRGAGAPHALPAPQPGRSVIAGPYRRAVAFLTGVVEARIWTDLFHDGLIARGYRALAGFLADVVDSRLWHDEFHDRVLTRGFRGLAFLTANPIDLGIIDGLANGVASLTRRLSGALRRTQTGYVRNYAFSIFIGVVLILGTLIFFR